MARYFDITAVTTSIDLDADRTGEAAFTVTNATASAIGGDAVVVPQAGAEKARYVPDHPTRRYDPGATQNIIVKVTAPATMATGTYGFQLRVLLSGGVPEEQYDDGPMVSFTVVETKLPQGDAKVPVKRNINWLIVGIGVVAAIVLIGAIAFVLLREPDPVVNGVDVALPPNATINLDTATVNGSGPDLLYHSNFFIDPISGIPISLGQLLIPTNPATIVFVGTTAPGRKGCLAASPTADAVSILGLGPGNFFCVRTDTGGISEVQLTQPVIQFQVPVGIRVTTWPR
jgi:hypothetical protein